MLNQVSSIVDVNELEMADGQTAFLPNDAEPYRTTHRERFSSANSKPGSIVQYWEMNERPKELQQCKNRLICPVHLQVLWTRGLRARSPQMTGGITLFRPLPSHAILHAPIPKEHITMFEQQSIEVRSLASTSLLAR